MTGTLVGILSDTHENVRTINRAVAALKAAAPSLVVHCGDIISPPILEKFSGLPIRFVFGNNDGERSGLKKKCAELGFLGIEDTAIFEVDGKKFFVNHGTNPRVIDDAAASQQYDFVLHGHTHEVRDDTVGKTRIINPGALFSAERYSCAVLEPATGKLRIIDIDD